MARVLVTGAAGFIRSHTCVRLLERGDHRLLGYDPKTSVGDGVKRFHDGSVKNVGGF